MTLKQEALEKLLGLLDEKPGWKGETPECDLRFHLSKLPYPSLVFLCEVIEKQLKAARVLHKSIG